MLNYKRERNKRSRNSSATLSSNELFFTLPSFFPRPLPLPWLFVSRLHGVPHSICRLPLVINPHTPAFQTHYIDTVEPQERSGIVYLVCGLLYISYHSHSHKVNPTRIPLRILLASLEHIIKNPILLPYPRTSSRAIPIYCVAVNGLREGSPKTGPVEWVDNIYRFYASRHPS